LEQAVAFQSDWNRTARNCSGPPRRPRLLSRQPPGGFGDNVVGYFTRPITTKPIAPWRFPRRSALWQGQGRERATWSAGC